jgi:hypothetical protein
MRNTNTWIIEEGITEVTRDYIEQNMPAGTTHMLSQKG